MYWQEKKGEKKTSEAVTHPSTDQTQCCLTSVIGRGHSADWAIQGPSDAWKKLLYINIGYIICKMAKTNLIFFYYFGNLGIQRAKTLCTKCNKEIIEK